MTDTEKRYLQELEIFHEAGVRYLNLSSHESHMSARDTLTMVSDEAFRLKDLVKLEWALGKAGKREEG